MTTYWQLLMIVAPVFALVALGVVLRRVRWIDENAENGLLRLVVGVTYPCLIFESVVNNTALRAPGNLTLSPLVGFVTTVFGVATAFYGGKLLGLTVGTGLRTFALATGICNYGYLALPIMEGLFGKESQGVLLVHNVGVEAALWTVGLLVLSGLSLREGWPRLINPPVVTLVVAVVANLTGAGAWIPAPLQQVIHALAQCAIPLGLLMTGSSIEPHLEKPARLFEPRITLGACALRLLLIPVGFLLLARWLPAPVELKRVLVVQAAMPSAVFPIVLARVYGGQPFTAVQIVVGTTAVGILSIPFWLRLGLAWVGV
ncbi:MAG TPA: AEC family transporter [Opitutaceae bacterium]